MKKTETNKPMISGIVHPERLRAEARTLLKKRFPEANGWMLNASHSWQPHLPDFIIDRISGRYTERVIALVIVEERITYRHLNRLEDINSKLTGRNCIPFGKIIIVPEGCDVASIHTDAEILVL